MLNTLKRVLLISSLSFAFAGIAFAEDVNIENSKEPVNSACSVAFMPDGNVKTEDMTLCNQDVGLNAVTLSMSSVFRANPAASGMASKMGITLPMYSESVNFISRPIGAVAAATVDICLTIIIIAAFYRLFMFGYRAMKDSSIERVVRDPSVYKAFAGFGLVAALSIKLGDINVAQLLVISSALFGLQIATFLFSSMVAVFNFDSHHNSVMDSYQEFLPQGDAYATKIVHGVYGAQEGALRTNFANIMHEEAQMLTDEADMSFFDKVLAALLSHFGYSTQDPTGMEYFDGLFNDMSVSLTQSSGLQIPISPHYNGAGAGSSAVAGNAFGALTLNDARVDDENKNKLSSALFEKSFKYRSLFHNTTTLNISSVLPPSVSPDMAAKIASSSAVANLKNLLQSNEGGKGDAAEAESIKQSGLALVELMKNLQNQYPSTVINPNDVIAIYQAIAFGAMSSEALAAKSLIAPKIIFSPFVGLSEFESSYMNSAEPFHKVILEALKGAKEMRKFNCISNFGDTALEINFWNEIKQNGGSSSLEDDIREYTDVEFFPICTLPNDTGTSFENIAPESMRNEAMEIAQLIKDGKAGETNLAIVLKTIEESAKKTSYGVEAPTGSATTLGGVALENARKNKNAIAAYYARVAAISRFAALEMVSINKDEEKQAFLTNMRQQGVVAISSYFMQLSKEAEKYSNIIFNASPKVEAKSNLRDGGNMPLTNSIWDEDEVLIKKKDHFPQTEAKFDQSLNDSNSDMMATSSIGDSAVSDEMGAVSEVMAWFADVLIPAEDVLINGFGLSGEDTLTEGLASCTTTTNCVEFKQHPLVTVSIFGKDLLITGVIIVIVDQIIQAVNKLLNGDVENDGGIFDALQNFAIQIVGKGIQLAIKFIAVLSNIMAIFGSVYILAGLFLGYIVPMLPYIAQLMMWLSWLAEFLLLFLSIPLLVAFAFIVKEDGQALFKPTSIISMLASLVLRAPLIFIAFMVFYTLSYAGIYIVNSTLFTMFKADIAGAGILGALLSLFSIVIFIVFTMGMYFLIFKTLTKMMTELPDYVLRPLGVESLNVKVSAGLEAFIAARTMSQLIEKSSRGVGEAGANLAKIAASKSLPNEEKGVDDSGGANKDKEKGSEGESKPKE